MKAPTWLLQRAVRRLRVALLVSAVIFIGVAGAGLAAAVMVAGHRLEATAFVSFQPRSLAAISPDAFRVIMPRYPVSAAAPLSLERVSLDTGVPLARLEDDVKVELDPDTTVVRIIVSNRDADLSARVANAVAEQLVTSTKADGLLDGELLAPAVVPTEKAGPSTSLIVAATMISAAILGLIGFDIVAVRSIRRGWPDQRRASRDVVRRAFGWFASH